MNQVNKDFDSRLRQGDILKNVEYIQDISEVDGIIEINKILFPYVIVLTQDCDLRSDFINRNENEPDSQDKYLLSVIVAPLYNYDHVHNGEHLSELKINMRTFPAKKGNTEVRFIKNNDFPRYHYIDFKDEVDIVPSVIDFKHYFTVNTETLNNLRIRNFICSVNPLFRERITQRFAFFLSRIGLPNN